MTWRQGHQRVQELLREGEIEKVAPSDALARRLLTESHKHLAAADQIVQIDESGAFQLAYDAARKACAALLARQGLRATTRGGHIAVQDTIRAQFGGKGGVSAFDSLPRMRRKRAASEYPNSDTPTTTIDDAREAIESGHAMLAAVEALLDSGRLGAFDDTG